MGKRELVALLKSSWCLVMVERLFLAVPQDCLRFVIVVFPDHTHLLFMRYLLSHVNMIRPNKENKCVYGNASENLGRVGTYIFFK